MSRKIFQDSVTYLVKRLLIFCLFMAAADAVSAKRLGHHAQAGVFVAADWDFTKGQPLEITGEWQVIWGSLVSPQDFDRLYKGDLFTLPARWNDIDQDNMDGSFGAATFRVSLELPEYDRDLAYYMIAAHSAYQIFLDGELTVKNGVVTESAEGFVANNVSRQFSGSSGRSEIVLQVANYVHAYGGPGHGLKLYDARALKRLLDSLSVIYGLVVGILLTIGLFHLILYLADRKDSNATIQLWFSILCFIIVYRVQGVIPLSHEYFHDSGYWRDLRFPYASLYAAPAVYLLFFRAVFPQHFPQKLTLALVAIASSGLLFTLTQSEFAYTSTRNFAIWLNVFVIVYSLIFTISAVLAKRRGARVILIANFVFLVTAVYDAIIYTDQSSGFDLTPFGILVLGLGYSYALFLGLQSRFFEARQNSKALKALNTDLEQQVVDRTLAFQAAAAKAENAASDKAMFIAAASHDLRQPLHALSLFNNVLKQKLVKNDVVPLDVAPLIARQENAIDNLGSLLQDTLDAARIDSHNKPLNLTTIASADIRDKLLDSFAARAIDRGVALSVEVEDGELYTDSVMLQRILSNLLDNALKAANKIVSVELRRHADNWCFDIRDDGAGIAQDDLDRVFGSYVSLEDPDIDAAGGYGLGLYVVKEFSNMLGAQIEVKSIVGEGSTFSLLLTGTKANQKIGGDLTNKKFNLEQLLKVRILILDDDYAILEALQALLEEWGCEVRSAKTAEMGLTSLTTFDAQVLILDYHLQGATGVQFKQQLDVQLGQQGLKPIPAIIVTGATERRILDEINNAGLTVLEKPVHANDLAFALISLLPDASDP